MLPATVGSVLLSTLLAAPAVPADPAAAASDASELKACLLVTAGNLNKTKSDKVNSFWHQVSTSVAKSLVAQLAADRVPVRIELIPLETKVEDVPGTIALALAREQCGKLLQISLQLGGGSGPEAYFAFQANLMLVEKTGIGFKLAKQMFGKNYRYPLNDETLKTLSMSELATKMKGELAAADVLPAALASEKAQAVP